MEKRKEKSDQSAVAELTREGLYKENKWLWEENKKLKSDLAYERAMLDNVRAEYQSLQNVIKKLKEENEGLKKELDKAHTAYRAVRKVNKELMNGYV